MWNREVSHQSPGIISELVQRSLLLPTWLLKHWDNALINTWSPLEPETAAHFFSQEPEIGHVCVCTTLCKRTRVCKEVTFWLLGLPICLGNLECQRAASDHGSVAFSHLFAA